MSRAEEIDKIIKLLVTAPAIIPVTNKRIIAEHLVDNGVGTKDRFTCGIGLGKSQMIEGLSIPQTNVVLRIEPIDYTEEK